MLNEEDSIKLAEKFDAEFEAFKADQMRRFRNFVDTRMPTLGDEHLDLEAAAFVKAGGSFRYFVQYRGGRIDAR